MPRKPSKARSPIHLHVHLDQYAPFVIISALVFGWLLIVFLAAYLSFNAGTLSASLDDILKQGPTYLLGLLTKVVTDKLGLTGRRADDNPDSKPEPVPVIPVPGQPLETIEVPAPDDDATDLQARESPEETGEIEPEESEAEAPAPERTKQRRNLSKTDKPFPNE